MTPSPSRPPSGLAGTPVRASGLLCAVCAGLFLFGPEAAGGVSGYRFLIPTVEALPGESVRLTVSGEHEQSAQGFTFAATYPSGDLTIDRVHFQDTILDAIGVDFFEAKVSPEEGTLIVGCLVDSQPPFEGRLIPNITFALEFFHLEVTVGPQASGELTVQLEDGLSQPPVDNLYSIDNLAFAVTELGSGGVVVPGAEPLFLRGDVNMDTSVDISDPISLLDYTFRGMGTAPPCMAAADANDDEKVDISDPIYLLEFLFTSGRPPPAPFGAPGGDPTPGLGCQSAPSSS